MCLRLSKTTILLLLLLLIQSTHLFSTAIAKTVAGDAVSSAPCRCRCGRYRRHAHVSSVAMQDRVERLFELGVGEIVEERVNHGVAITDPEKDVLNVGALGYELGTYSIAFRVGAECVTKEEANPAKHEQTNHESQCLQCLDNTTTI